jgi:hypothetical protein
MLHCVLDDTEKDGTFTMGLGVIRLGIECIRCPEHETIYADGSFQTGAKREQGLSPDQPEQGIFLRTKIYPQRASTRCGYAPVEAAMLHGLPHNPTADQGDQEVTSLFHGAVVWSNNKRVHINNS